MAGNSTGTQAGKIVRIGGASGALNDSAIAVPGLLKVPDLNYLAFDYLGEGAMGIFRRMKQADPASGFLPDFVDIHVGPYLAELKARNIRVVANAGGVNPEGLADLIRRKSPQRRSRRPWACRKARCFVISRTRWRYGPPCSNGLAPN